MTFECHTQITSNKTHEKKINNTKRTQIFLFQSLMEHSQLQRLHRLLVVFQFGCAVKGFVAQFLMALCNLVQGLQQTFRLGLLLIYSQLFIILQGFLKITLFVACVACTRQRIRVKTTLCLVVIATYTQTFTVNLSGLSVLRLLKIDVTQIAESLGVIHRVFALESFSHSQTSLIQRNGMLVIFQVVMHQPQSVQSAINRRAFRGQTLFYSVNSFIKFQCLRVLFLNKFDLALAAKNLCVGQAFLFLPKFLRARFQHLPHIWFSSLFELQPGDIFLCQHYFLTIFGKTHRLRNLQIFLIISKRLLMKAQLILHFCQHFQVNQVTIQNLSILRIKFHLSLMQNELFIFRLVLVFYPLIVLQKYLPRSHFTGVQSPFDNILAVPHTNNVNGPERAMTDTFRTPFNYL